MISILDSSAPAFTIVYSAHSLCLAMETDKNQNTF